jgi:anti-sigma factor RsiW
MARPRHTDEILMAYADGELDEAKSQEIAADISKSPALARKVEMFRQSRRLAKDAFAPLENEKVPDALLASIKAEIAEHEKPAAPAIKQFPKTPLPLAANDNWRRWAAAASLAVLLAGGIGYFFGQQSGSSADAPRFALEQPVGEAIGQRLARLPSGAEETWDDRRLKMIASFADASGRLCREFEYHAISKDTFVAVACRADDNWQLTFAVEAPPSDGSYAPASSMQALDAYVSAIGADTSMTADQEKAALTGLR